MPFTPPGCNCSHIRQAANIYEFTYERARVPRFRSITVGISYNYSSCNAMRRWAAHSLAQPECFCLPFTFMIFFHGFFPFAISMAPAFKLTFTVCFQRMANKKCVTVRILMVNFRSFSLRFEYIVSYVFIYFYCFARVVSLFFCIPRISFIIYPERIQSHCICTDTPTGSAISLHFIVMVIAFYRDACEDCRLYLSV